MSGDRQDQEVRWVSPREAPIVIAGFAWLEQEGIYRRLPLKPELPLPSGVEYHANGTAGGQIRFSTDSSGLSIKVKLKGSANMFQTTPACQCGFDCYIEHEGISKFYGTAEFHYSQSDYETQIFDFNDARRMQNITLYFPIYQGVEEVFIGIDSDARILPPPPYKNDKRIVVYGTSITQGGCANRPGMCYTNILSRSIPLEFINMGFAGSGLGEPEVADVISRIERPGLFVLDYEANVSSPEHMRNTLPDFIRILRSRHPRTPILVVSKIRNGKEPFLERLLNLRLQIYDVQTEIVEQLRRDGDEHIHFFDGSNLLGDEYGECTVDGTHPTDLGFLRMARNLLPVFQELAIGDE